MTRKIVQDNRFKESVKELKTVSIDTIKPYWRNPRDNTDAVGPVMESIKRFGYCQPILVDKENVIIAGHTRYKALMEMEVKEVQVLILDMPEDKAKQYRIVDNKTSDFAYWNDADLIAELREFNNLEKDFQVFFVDDLSKLMKESSGKSKKDVSDATLARKAEEESKKFADISRVDQLAITCPDCANIFYMNRKDLA